MSTETHKAVIRRFHAAFDKGDFEGMRACIAPGLVAYHTGVTGPQDFAAFEQMGRAFMSGFSQSRNLVEDQVAEGDRVATRVNWTAIHSGTFNGIPPSNRPVQMDVYVFDRFENGKIVDHRAVFDVMGLLQQIGAIPAEAAA